MHVHQFTRRLESLRAAGRVVRRMIQAMKRAIRPGVTTAELDDIGARVMREHGARSAPSLVYGFPGTSCISVNEEAVHGIPNGRALSEGDLVKLDVTVKRTASWPMPRKPSPWGMRGKNSYA